MYSFSYSVMSGLMAFACGTFPVHQGKNAQSCFLGLKSKSKPWQLETLVAISMFVLFPLFSVPFVHLSYLSLLNRGKLVENCDNILSQPAAHQFDFNFKIRVFQVVHVFLLTSELAPQRYEWTQTLSRLLQGDLGSFSCSVAIAEAQKNTP